MTLPSADPAQKQDWLPAPQAFEAVSTRRSEPIGADTGAQLTPPSPVRKIVPAWPTVTPVMPSAKATSRSRFVSPVETFTRLQSVAPWAGAMAPTTSMTPASNGTRAVRRRAPRGGGDGAVARFIFGHPSSAWGRLRGGL